MIQYILETIAFQLIFLLVYDLFLKKETFFQWNRAYLLFTFVLSLVLPWVKIEAFKTTVSQEAILYPDFLWQLNGIEFTAYPTEKTSFWQLLSIYEWIVTFGGVAMILWLGIKLFRIQSLRKKGVVTYHSDFTKILVKESSVAFSFFKQVFVGENIPEEKIPQILTHELVHIKQWHSLDLLFFELMRIVMWYNPMVYLYQSRMAELHEFIADSKGAMNDKPTQFQILLSEAFQTQNLSFVNQFFKKSLIKKRIAMLSKKKSKTTYQLKYIILLPLVLAMLVYSSCETEKKDNLSGITDNNIQLMTQQYEDINRKIEEALKSNLEFEELLILVEKATSIQTQIEESVRVKYPSVGEFKLFGDPHKRALLMIQLKDPSQTSREILKRYNELDQERNRLLQSTSEKNPIIVKLDGQLQELKKSIDVSIEKGVPFALVDEVPIFPGCFEATNKKVCFQEKMQAHIREHFNYPKEAQDLGIEGRVAVLFTIDENGEITNIQKRGPHELLESEAERIIKKLPKMQPGKHQGQMVQVPFSLPIVFKLD